MRAAAAASATAGEETACVRAIPNRVGVSGGPGKALANIGAVRAGLLNVLITDQYTAAEMLGILKNEEAPTNLDARPA